MIPASAAVRRAIGRVRPAIALTAVLATLTAQPVHAAAPGCVIVRASPVTAHVTGYGTVVATSTVRVRSAQTGVLSGFDVLPGTTVRAGDLLGQLKGPIVDAARAARQQAVSQAQDQLAVAQQLQTIAQTQLEARLTTQEAMARAEAAVRQARTALTAAQAERAALQDALRIVSPADGTVLQVEAAEGDLLDAGQTVVTVQPEKRLWVRAACYGAAAQRVTPGMTGTFVEADEGVAVPIKVAATLTAQRPDGATTIVLVAAGDDARWRSGMFGTVTLNGPTQKLPTVPTRALILDQGQWWVLVRDGTKETPQAVVPGPAQGWDTVIEQGLEPGAQVVVENAYLEFHRDVAQRYQQPD